MIRFRLSAAAAVLLGAIGARADVDGGAQAPADAGPSAVEVHGLQVPISPDPTLPGRRPVEGAVDANEQPLHKLPAPDRDPYEDFLDSRSSDLDNCAVWSPGGAAVKGWFVAEWRLEADGVPHEMRVIRSTLASPLIEACLLREIAQWRFPPPPAEHQLVRHAFYFTSPQRTDRLPPEVPQ